MNNRQDIFRLIKVAIIGTALGLGGCNSLTLPAADLSAGETLLDRTNARAKDDPAWFAGHVQEQQTFSAKYNGELAPGMAVYLESDIYIYDDKAITVYLQRIVDRLLLGWQGQKPQLSIIIETGRYCNAYADTLHQLHVSTGLLRDMENEDQLASMLAHEIGHILLRHNNEKSITERTGTVFELSGMMMAAGGALVDQHQGRAKYRQKGQDGLLGCQSLGLVWADLLAPQWSRENEREADKLGVDLLVQANYNYEEFPTVIEKIHDGNARRSERLATLQTVASTLIAKNHNRITTSAGAKADAFLETMRRDLENLFIEKSADTVAAMSKSHDDRVERIDSIKTYIQQAYGEGDLPPEISHEQFSAIVKNSRSTARLLQDLAAIEAMAALLDNQLEVAGKKSAGLLPESPVAPVSTVIAQSSLEISKRKYREAEKYLGALIVNKKSPSEAYLKLAEVHMANRHYPEAEKVLLLGSARIGRDYKFLPTLVRLNKVSGDIKTAEENTIRCKEYDDAVSLSLSKMVFGKNDNDSSYYRQCVDALGYDVLARRGAKAKTAPASIIDGALKSIFQ